MPPRAAGGVGIGLRPPHYRELAGRHPPLAFLEVHAENFFADGGGALAWLERFRGEYPLSIHGVGLSLGSADCLDEAHLQRLASLVERFEPMLVSQHLCWSSFGGRHANDLLPLPYTEEAIAHVVPRIVRIQERLGRRLAVENVSAYVRFGESALHEWEFVSEVARRADCDILLDVNNIWVNAVNHGFDAVAYVDAVDPARVSEYHLAGFEATDAGLIDTHGARVCAEVWDLYAHAAARIGRRPTLVEWDTEIPALDVLLDEARKAREIGLGAVRAVEQVA